MKDFSPKTPVFLVDTSRAWCGVDRVVMDLAEAGDAAFDPIPVVRAASAIHRRLRAAKRAHASLPRSRAPLSVWKAWRGLLPARGAFLMHVHTAGDYLWAFALKPFYPGMRLVFSRHNSFRLSAPLRLLCRLYRVRWVAVSRFIETTLRAQGFRPDLISTIPNGVRRERVSAHERRAFLKKHRLDGGRKRIGFLARIDRSKGPELFLAAARELLESNDDWVFLVAGRGDAPAYEARFRRQFEAALPAVNRRWVGFTEKPAVFQRCCDVFAAPSLRSWGEPFGLTVVESILQGTPVAATPWGAFPEILSSGGLGRLARGERPRDFARAIKEALGSGKRISAALSNRMAARYSLARMRAAHADVWAAGSGRTSGSLRP